MRKNMTGVLRETLESHPDCVYIGEDVEHGGYYMVTDGLAKAFPQRVRDFPPDETSLVGMVALPLTGDLGWWSHSSCTGHWLCPDRAAAEPVGNHSLGIHPVSCAAAAGNGRRVPSGVDGLSHKRR